MLLKQICQRVGLLINRHFEEARLLVAFYHEFKHVVHFSINRADKIFFLQFILLRELNAMRLSICKIKPKRCSLGRKTSLYTAKILKIGTLS